VGIARVDELLNYFTFRSGAQRRRNRGQDDRRGVCDRNHSDTAVLGGTAVSRRSDRARKRRRKEREIPRPDPGPPERAPAHWHASVASLTGRGFGGQPIFPPMIFGPEVSIDLQGVDPPREASEKMISAIVAQTVTQRPS
jgi:hypothetical protein